MKFSVGLGVFCCVQLYGKALGSLMGASGSHEMWWRGQSTCLCLKLRSEDASKPFFLWLAPNRRLQKKGLETLCKSVYEIHLGSLSCLASLMSARACCK